MCNKNFIFLNTSTKQFFRSAVSDPVEGFRMGRDYRLACGDVDAQGFDNDRQDMNDAGWTEIPSPQFITVKLYYMKHSGKYYSEGEIKLNRGEVVKDPAKSWYNLMEHVRSLLDKGELPGLIKGTKEFDVFLSCEEHPNYVPALFKAQ